MPKIANPIDAVSVDLIEKLGEKISPIDAAPEQVKESPRILLGILTMPQLFFVEFADMGFKPGDKQTLIKDAKAGIPAAKARLEFAKAFLVEMFLHDIVEVEQETVYVQDGKEYRKRELFRRPRHVVPPFKSRYDPNFKPARDAEPRMIIQDTLDAFEEWLANAVFWDERTIPVMSRHTGLTRKEIVDGIKTSADWQKAKQWIAEVTAKIRGELKEEVEQLDFERSKGELLPPKPKGPTFWEQEGIKEPTSWAVLSKWTKPKLRKVCRGIGLAPTGSADELRQRICERLIIEIPAGAASRHGLKPSPMIVGTTTAPAVEPQPETTTV
jgi:hypothetical protein